MAVPGSRTAWNVGANLAGQVLAAGLALVCVPWHRHFLGIEAFGLAGLFLTLQGTFAVLNLGLSTTLNRQFALLSVDPGKAGEMWDLLRTLEVFAWGLGLVLSLGLVALAPWLADHWFQAEALTPDAVRASLILLGVVLPLQCPLAFYAGGLMGLQHQVFLNGINLAMAALRYAGGVLVLWLIAPTPTAFLAWQLGVTLLQTLLAAFWLRRCLPRPVTPPRFRRELLRDIRRFAAGMTGISLTLLLLAQMDKVILSKVLTLEALGYYLLASLVAAGLTCISTPLFLAYFPRLAQVVQGGGEALRELYHGACQLLSVLVLPAAVVVALFPSEVLRVWTGNPSDAAEAHLVLTLLIAGTALTGLYALPYALQLAHGWTRLALALNLTAVGVLAPAMAILAWRFGGAGAAGAWAAVNAGQLVLGLWLTHRYLLPGEQRRWYVEDVGLPLGAAVLTAGLARWLLPAPTPRGLALVYLVGVGLAALLAAALAAPRARGWMLGRMARQPDQGLSRGQPPSLSRRG
jgi:O-antigen/teichoic acid export membrane protein